MRQAPGEAVQKLCPHCSTLAYTGDTHCPWCGGSYKRRLWPALLALLLVQTTLVPGGTALMLVVFGREAESALDQRVTEVDRDLDASFDQVRRAVRQELDRRLPPAP